MRINDTETQAIADLYREMIGEQVAGKSALTGQELVTALVTACMSKWYDLTSKFQARPEIYDVAPTEANDSYNVMKLNPGSDVRDDAFEAIVKSTNDIAKELNRLFGKDVFEPRITRQHGKLEALVAFSQNEGGVFQAKGEATEGHTTIHITMPKEAELERAFAAMTDTPHHGDGADEQGVGDMDDTIDADPIAGDPSPDYDPEFDVASDADQAEVDAALGDLDAEPEGDPMDDLSAEEADAAFEEPRRRSRFEALYADAAAALSEAESYRIRVKGKDGDKVSKAFKSEGEADRERRSNPDFRGGTIEPVEEVQETAAMDREPDPKVAKPGEDSDPHKKPKPGEKDEENTKPKTFREFVDDKEDGTPGFEPKQGSVPLDMSKVESLERNFRKVLRRRMINPEGATIVGPENNYVNGIEIETAEIVFYLDWEKFKRDEFEGWAKQVISHWKKHVGGDDEFDISSDVMGTNHYRLRGCEYDGLEFDVYISDNEEHEVHVSRIRAADAPLGEGYGEEMHEEAPAVSVGGATAAGSSPAPDVVKDIGKKKKTRVRRRNESVDTEMDAINEALKLGRF